MKYQVFVTAEAETAIVAYIDYIATERQEPINAAKVWDALWKKIATLEAMPNRCPEAPESIGVDYTVRALVLKKTIVILYRVEEEARQVMVIGLRTGGRQPQ